MAFPIYSSPTRELIFKLFTLHSQCDTFLQLTLAKHCNQSGASGQDPHLVLLPKTVVNIFLIITVLSKLNPFPSSPIISLVPVARFLQEFCRTVCLGP